VSRTAVKHKEQENYRVFLGRNTKLVVEGVMPDLLHVVPVGHDTVLNGVLQGEDTTLGLGLVSNVGVLLAHANHHSLVSWATDDRRKDSARCVISGEASLAHSGSVIHDESLNIITRHIQRVSVL
jgi:hypothetical protein